jgi:hypothetical protein
MERAALTKVVAVLLHLLDVVLGQHRRRVPHGFPSFPYATIHQLPPPPPPPIELAEPKSAAVKLAGGGLVRMEQGRARDETMPRSILRARIQVAGGDTESACHCHRDRAFIGLRVVGLVAAGLDRSKYAGLLPFPFCAGPYFFSLGEGCQT